MVKLILNTWERMSLWAGRELEGPELTSVGKTLENCGDSEGQEGSDFSIMAE